MRANISMDNHNEEEHNKVLLQEQLQDLQKRIQAVCCKTIMLSPDQIYDLVNKASAIEQLICDMEEI